MQAARAISTIWFTVIFFLLFIGAAPPFLSLIHIWSAARPADASYYISARSFRISSSFVEMCIRDREGMAEQNQNQDMQKPHKRRVRYKGTHPRTFEEKYKEREPEKYAETIEKVISKGSTPAGMHLSICVDEILEFLQIQPGQRGLDATLGYGGHSRRMLEKLEGSGHLYGLDVDPIEIVKTTARLRENGFGEEILTVRQMNFAEIDLLSEEVGKFDFVLADLGVSSMQIDNPERGFTYKAEGPLDLRLDPEKLSLIHIYHLRFML